jgi:hypothetical protein
MTPPTKSAASLLPNHKLVPSVLIPRNPMPPCSN